MKQFLSSQHKRDRNDRVDGPDFASGNLSLRKVADKPIIKTTFLEMTSLLLPELMQFLNPAIN